MKRNGYTYFGVVAALGALSLSAIGLIGCGHDEPAPKTAESAKTATTTTQANAPQQRRTDQAVNLSEDIRRICNISDAERTPKFDFDSTHLSSADRDVLAQVAKCLTTGPLKGRSVKLVGRADPRGEPEYNMSLGESRATSVRNYLTSLGVSGTNVSETSRGALDASGNDEESWRRDRRVDVELAK